jgi:hypothetical protein
MLALLIALTAFESSAELAARLRALIAEPPEVAAERALAAGDQRLWGSEGLGYRVPGTTYSNFDPPEPCGVKMLPLLSDFIHPESWELFGPGERWAAAYNFHMIVRSGCLPPPPDPASAASQAEVAELRALLSSDPVEAAERAAAAGETALWRRHGEGEPIGHLDAGGEGEPCPLRPMPGLRPVYPVAVHELGRRGATYDWPRDYNKRVVKLTGCRVPPREPRN